MACTATTLSFTFYLTYCAGRRFVVTRKPDWVSFSDCTSACVPKLQGLPVWILCPPGGSLPNQLNCDCLYPSTPPPIPPVISSLLHLPRFFSSTWPERTCLSLPFPKRPVKSTKITLHEYRVSAQTQARAMNTEPSVCVCVCVCVCAATRLLHGYTEHEWHSLSAKFPDLCFSPVILLLRYQMALVVEPGRFECVCWGCRLATCSSFALT
jgi:hypothetical protein